MRAELGFPSAGTVSYAEQTSVGHSSSTAGFCCIRIAKEGNRGLVLLGERGLSSSFPYRPRTRFLRPFLHLSCLKLLSLI